MRDRAILHSDANCFYASVETVLNPEFRGKAIAVRRGKGMAGRLRKAYQRWQHHERG